MTVRIQASEGECLPFIVKYGGTRAEVGDGDFRRKGGSLGEINLHSVFAYTLQPKSLTTKQDIFCRRPLVGFDVENHSERWSLTCCIDVYCRSQRLPIESIL